MTIPDIRGCGLSAELSGRWRVKAAEIRPYSCESGKPARHTEKLRQNYGEPLKNEKAPHA